MKFKLTPYNLQELGQRQNQEDSLFPGIGQQTANDRLFILCDGMGGHEKGEVASATVCETMSKCILSRWNPNEPLSDGLLQQAIEEAYDALDAKDNGEEKKMGTTMTFLCFHANGVTAAHIGDSRIYQLRPATKSEPARIVFKTRDHSLVNDLIDIGEITEEEAKNHPQKNVITRAMQPCQERRAKATIAHLTDIQEGDYFYMCSDGMLEQSTDDNILNIITKKCVKNKQKVEMLRSVTSENKDNHTAHIIYVGEDKPKMFITMIIAALIVASIAIIASVFLPDGKGRTNEREKDSVSIKTEENHSNDHCTPKHHETTVSISETNCSHNDFEEAQPSNVNDNDGKPQTETNEQEISSQKTDKITPSTNEPQKQSNFNIINKIIKTSKRERTNEGAQPKEVSQTKK